MVEIQTIIDFINGWNTKVEASEIRKFDKKYHMNLYI